MSQLLTSAQVADWLSVSRNWVVDHARGVNRPVLPSVKLGKLVRFRREDVEAFVVECQRMLEKRA